MGLGWVWDRFGIGCVFCFVSHGFVFCELVLFCGYGFLAGCDGWVEGSGWIGSGFGDGLPPTQLFYVKSLFGCQVGKVHEVRLLPTASRPDTSKGSTCSKLASPNLGLSLSYIRAFVKRHCSRVLQIIRHTLPTLCGSLGHLTRQKLAV